MTKLKLVCGFLLLLISCNSSAHDSERIDKMDKEIQDLKFRFLELETLLERSVSKDKLLLTDGWKSIVNWRKLTTKMTPDDVQKILDAPHRVDGGNVTFWYYQNGGNVTFMFGKVRSWSEPLQ